MLRRFLVLGALVLAACGVESASGAVRPPARATFARAASCAADSLCYVLAWPAVSDANGPADHYHVRISTPSRTVTDTTITGTSLRVAIPKPAAGTSIPLTAQVWSIRRGLQSVSAASATTTASVPDVPPPPPSSVTITPDTVAAAQLPGVRETVYAVALVTSDSTATVIGGSPVMHWCQPIEATTTYLPGDTTWVFTLTSRN